MKLFLDKYFTPIELANYCWDLIDEVIGLKNIDIIIIVAFNYIRIDYRNIEKGVP